ncbi:MAG: hypothetical protein WAN46_05105 [Gammaproteobacteria bacterium]
MLGQCSEQDGVSTRKRKSRKPLEVSVSFEPNRLAEAHLIDAYAQVVPVPRRASRWRADTSPEAPCPERKEHSR